VGRRRTPWTPSHHVDGLRVLGQSRQVGDGALLAVRLDAPELLYRSAQVHAARGEGLPHPHVVVAARCRQASLAVGLKVRRVDGRVLVVPGHQERSSLHRRWGRCSFRTQAQA